MREFSVSFREALTKGLRPDVEGTGREQFLRECYNMRPTDSGLEDYTGPVDPFNGSVTTNWPWPQLFFLSETKLLVGETTIESVDTTTDPWGRSSLNTRFPKNPQFSRNIQLGGGAWHAADMGEGWYLFKGPVTVFGTGLHHITSRNQRFFVDTTTTIQTGTAHKGRVVFGGFDSSNFWNTEWESIFTSWQNNREPTGVEFQYDDIGENWVAWSSIGGGDLPLWLFPPDDISSDLGINLNEENLLERMRRNEFGWMPMPFNGKVQNILPLGDRLVVYGEDGIALMELTEARNPDTPYTYGVREISSVGIQGRSAVASGGGRHVFLGQDGYLWVIQGEGGMQRLGYQGYMEPLMSRTVVCEYNPSEEEYYICSDLDGFVLTKNGLAEHKDHITGGGQYKGTFYSLSHSPNTSHIEVVTEGTDMKVSANKRVNNVHVSSYALSNLQTSLRYKHDRNRAPQMTEFEQTDFVLNNAEGVAHVRSSGVEFQAELRGSAATGARISGINIRYQVSDKRAIRGTFRDAG